MTKKRIIITSAISLLVILGGVALFGPKKEKITYDTAKIARGSVVQTVEATGAVISSADIDLKFEASGRISAIRVKVGDSVKARTLLAELDNRDASLGVQKTLSAVLAAQAAYDKLAQGATPEDINVSKAAVASAQSSLEVARQALADAKSSSETSLAGAYADLSGSLETAFLKSSSAVQTLTNDVYDTLGNLRGDVTPSDANLAQQATNDFKAAKTGLSLMTSDIAAVRATQDRDALDRLADSITKSVGAVRDAAQTTNAMMQNAIPSGAATQATVDAKKAATKLVWIDMVAAYNAVVSERQTVAETKSSNLATVNAASDKVKTALSALSSAQASLDLKKAPATSFDLENARAVLAQARATASEAEVALEQTRIVAPFDGTIAQVTGRVGSTVSGADVMMRIHGQDVYEIEADVPETDIAKLSAGMTGTVTLDAYGQDKTFPIKLTTIDNAETIIQSIVYYKTRFTLTSPDQPVRAGMTANVKVVAAQKDAVLFIPLRAVHTRDDGGKFVRVLRDNQTQEVSVTLGLRGDNNLVEMTSGPAEGEDVVLATYVNGKAV